MLLSSDLTQEMRDIEFSYRAVLTGVNKAFPRWSTCLTKAVGPPPVTVIEKPTGWGFAAAHEYVLSYFDVASKGQAERMVEGLITAFKELVEETEWMDSETKEKAKEKADSMLQQIGYPDWLLDTAKVDQYYR
jgi:membrane metallo-endopeptidase-like protein 1